MEKTTTTYIIQRSLHSYKGWETLSEHTTIDQATNHYKRLTNRDFNYTNYIYRLIERTETILK